MFVTVQPKYYGGDPAKGIQCLVIELMPDPEPGEPGEPGIEEKRILDLLTLLKKSETLQVTALPPDSFGTPISVEVRGRYLAVDF